MAKMIDCQGNFIPNLLAHLRYIVLQQVHSFGRNTDTGKRMRNRRDLVGASGRFAQLQRAACGIDGRGCMAAHLLQKTDRGGEGSGFLHEQADAQIHF